MKFVFYSPNFFPMVGGLENVVKDLATELNLLGHTVRVLTLTPADEPDTFPFEVVRKASFWQVVQQARWADVFVQVNISLKGILPYLLVRPLLVLFHQGLYPKNSWFGQLKWAVAHRASVNIGCSKFIAQHFQRCYTLSNPYNEAIFGLNVAESRNKDIVFLGRLVSEKGCAVLLRSLYILHQQTGQTPSVTIIGNGPEKPNLENLVNELNLGQRVRFEGIQQGETLARRLNQHHIMVVPSVYEEPFGIVALEGIASGCFVIGSNAGGLPEAIGRCGVTFPIGDETALAGVLARALTEPDWRDSHLQYAAHHLQAHTRPAVAEGFLSIIEEAI